MEATRAPVNSVGRVPVLSSPLVGSVRRPASTPYLRYLVLNVLVSAATVTVILLLWGRGPRPLASAPTPTFDVGAALASKVPTPTPTLPPTPTPHTYTVQGGDTLFSIARDLDIEPEALMAANGLTDPDRLSVGQVLTIPEISGPSSPSPARHFDAGAPDPHASPVRFSGAAARDSRRRRRGHPGQGDRPPAQHRRLVGDGGLDPR